VIPLASTASRSELVLAAGKLCRIHTGRYEKGSAPASEGPEMDAYWRRKAVWNNSGDEAHLRDANGKAVYVYGYKATGS
jgi:hypothetical protein